MMNGWAPTGPGRCREFPPKVVALKCTERLLALLNSAAWALDGQVGSAGSTEYLRNGPLRNAAPGASLPPVSTSRYVKSGLLARWIRPTIWGCRKCHVAGGSI
jgi:hypothetical protein